MKKFKHTCKRCGWTWEGKEKPACCPACKRYDWDKSRELLQ